MVVKALIAILIASSIHGDTGELKLLPVSEPVVQKDKLSFSLSLEGIESNLSIQSTSVMPGDNVDLMTSARLLRADASAQEIDGGWRWQAPAEPGHYQLDFRQNGETMRVNVFVLTPFENGKDHSLNGYRIGSYAEEPLRGLPQYLPPTGFIDLKPGMEDIQVSPNFRLGQFICKQQPGYDPAYLLVRPQLLLKLETLLEAANEKGWDADTFYVMSGFRTPFYNAAIGNKTTSSRHLFGDAADIYIDQDGDGNMDDLNGDGKITKEDAMELAKLAQSLSEAEIAAWPSGGIGIYDANAVHGPFVHIDARGYPARWG